MPIRRQAKGRDDEHGDTATSPSRVASTIARSSRPSEDRHASSAADSSCSLRRLAHDGNGGRCERGGERSVGDGDCVDGRGSRSRGRGAVRVAVGAARTAVRGCGRRGSRPGDVDGCGSRPGTHGWLWGLSDRRGTGRAPVPRRSPVTGAAKRSFAGGWRRAQSRAVCRSVHSSARAGNAARSMSSSTPA